MLRVIVRRSTLTIRSTIGISRNRPGPFGSAISRPSRKTIPRSYSRATLIAEIRKSTTRKSRIATRINAAATAGSYPRAGSRTNGLDPSRCVDRPPGPSPHGLSVGTASGALVGDRFHDERQLGADARDAHLLARPERLLAGRPRAPELAVDEDHVVAAG